MSVSMGNGVDLGNLVTSTTNPITGGVELIAGDLFNATVVIKSDGENDQEKINIALQKYAHVVISDMCYISSPVILNSGNTLEFSIGAGLKIEDSITVGFNCITNYSAVNFNKLITDGAITSGSNVFSSSQITAFDAGKSIYVQGAAFGGTLLCAKIISAANGSASLDVSATTTVTNAVAKMYVRDNNIKIIGGLIDRNNGLSIAGLDQDGYYSGQHIVNLRRIDGLNIVNSSFHSVGGKYAISLGDVNTVEVTNPFYDVSSDGCHIQGPATGVKVIGSRGLTGDDPCAITASDYLTYRDCQGNVSNVSFIDSCMSNYEGRHLVTGGPGLTVRDVYITGLKGKGYAGVVIPSVYGEGGFSPQFDNNVSRVFIRDVDIDVQATYPVIYIGGEVIGSVDIDGVTCNAKGNNTTYVRVDKNVDSLSVRNVVRTLDNVSTTQYGIYVGTGAVVKSLDVDNVSLINATGTYFSGGFVTVKGTVNLLSVSAYKLLIGAYTSAGNIIVQVESGGNVGGAVLSNTVEKNAKYMLDVLSGATVGPVVLNGFYRSGCGRMVNCMSAVDITFGPGQVIGPLVEAVSTTGAAVIIRGGGCYLGGAFDGVKRSASESIRVINQDFPADTAKLTPVAGDRCLNSNVASPPLIVGPCIYNGTAWKSLLSLP